MADFIIFAIVILNDAAAAATTAAIAPWPRSGVLLVSSSLILATHSSWGVGVGAETSSSSSSSSWHDLDLGDDEDGDGDERSRFGGGDANVAENGSPSRQKGKLFLRQKQIHVQSERRVGRWQHCLSSIERLCRHFALV